MNERKSKKMALAAVLMMAAVATLCVIPFSEESDAVITNPTYGTATEISIAPGMRYTYTPTWPADLTVTTTIQVQKQGSLSGSNVNIATLSSGKTLIVNIPSNASVGTQYHVVLKATSTNPDQTAYIYIVFNVVANLSMNVSQANVVKGTAVTITPVTSGMGTITYSSTNLPSYLSLNASTGKITGTCNTPGTVTFNLTATNNFGESVTKTVTFTVYATLAMTVSQANVIQGTSVVIDPVTSGGTGTYTYTASGMPSYLSLNASTGEITGTCNTVGTVSFTVTCTSGTQSVTKTVSFTVVSALSPTNSPLNGVIAMPS